MNAKKFDYQKYWNKNIKEWGDLYLQISHGHEDFNCPKSLNAFYNKFIIPHEAKLMKVRYQKTIEFIDQHVQKGIVVSDIGCGTGIFTARCLTQGAIVNVIDISESAIKLTQEHINNQFEECKKNVSYHLMDVQKKQLPDSNVSIAVGVLPYIEDIDAFFSNVLSKTDLLFCQFSSSSHIVNLIRKYFRFLNVRNLQFQSRRELQAISARHGFDMISCERFATGYLTVLKRRTVDYRAAL